MSETNLYQQLKATSNACFDEAHYEAAYHVLCAAKHYAKDINNSAYLREILEIAHRQSYWINLHAPESVLSKQATIVRNGVNLYESLYRQLEGDIQIVETNHKNVKTQE